VCVCANETKVIRLRYGTVDCKCDKRSRDEGIRTKDSGLRTPDERQRQQIVLQFWLVWDLGFGFLGLGCCWSKPRHVNNACLSKLKLMKLAGTRNPFKSLFLQHLSTLINVFIYIPLNPIHLTVFQPQHFMLDLSLNKLDFFVRRLKNANVSG